MVTARDCGWIQWQAMCFEPELQDAHACVSLRFLRSFHLTFTVWAHPRNWVRPSFEREDDGSGWRCRSVACGPFSVDIHMRSAID